MYQKSRNYFTVTDLALLQGQSLKCYTDSMPSKNSLKEYAQNSYYHIYNRGVAKQVIFIDEQDYKVFLSYLKTYLTPVDKNIKTFPSRQLKNYYQELRLLAYCILPNHYHLFIWQKEANTIANFLKSIATKYSMYFNKKYQRSGPVFEGRYKAVMVKTETQFIYLSKYIHRNPVTSGTVLEDYKYSSYINYLGRINQTWINTEEILSYFSKINPYSTNSYKTFIEETDESDLLPIKEVVLDL